MNGYNMRQNAHKAPFSVLEVFDPHVTNINGRQVAYNIVDKKGLGVAKFGVDRNVAEWFCAAANLYAGEILNDHRA